MKEEIKYAIQVGGDWFFEYELINERLIGCMMSFHIGQVEDFVEMKRIQAIMNFKY